MKTRLRFRTSERSERAACARGARRTALCLLAAAAAAAACDSRLELSDEIRGPEQVSIYAARSRVVLAWSPVEDAESYTVYQGRENDVSPSIHTRAIASTAAELVVTQVIPGTDYYFVVTATIGGEETEPTAVVSAAALEDTPVSGSTSWTADGQPDNGDPVTRFGAALAAADLDLDGRMDLAVGAPEYIAATGTAALGYVSVFRGIRGGLDTAPAFHTTGKQVGGGFGSVLLAVPDFGDDGLGELLAAEPLGFLEESGRVYAYKGRPGAALEGGPIGCYGPDFQECPFLYASDFHAQIGSGLGAFEDLDGDLAPELLAGSPFLASAGSGGLLELFRGSGLGGVAYPPDWSYRSGIAGDALGAAVSAGRDATGDGIPDALAGAPGTASERGRVYLFTGTGGSLSAAPAWSADGDAAGDELGRTVLLTDLDCDGIAEVVIGSPGWDGAAVPDAGRVSIFRGGQLPLSQWAEVTGVQAGERLGVIAAAGDVDGDGCGDLLVGSPGYDGIFDDEGRAQLLGGGTTGLDPDPVWTDAGRAPDARFGEALAGAGDTDGDGFLDVAAGAPGYDGGIGRAMLYRGLPPTGPRATAGLPARVAAGAPFSPLLAGFSDPSAGEAFACVWDWDDGSVTELASCEPGTAGEVSHAWSEPGRYRVKLTVLRGSDGVIGESVTTVLVD